MTTDAMAPVDLARPVLLFSGTCRFCRWAARVIARLDRRRVLALLPLVDLFDEVVAGSRKHLSRFVPDGPAPRRYP